MVTVSLDEGVGGKGNFTPTVSLLTDYTVIRKFL